MEVKIKTKDLPENLELGNSVSLIGGNKKYTSYRVALTDLSDVLKVLHEVGVYKVKIILDEPKEFWDESENADVIVKATTLASADEECKQDAGVGEVEMSQLECLLYVTSGSINLLKEEKDVKAFFEAIGFNDVADYIYDMYKELTKIPKKEVEEYKEIKHGKMEGLYHKVFDELYPNDIPRSQTVEYDAIKRSIKTWCRENCNWYLQHHRIVITYVTFLKFLLRNTGYNYF